MKVIFNQLSTSNKLDMPSEFVVGTFAVTASKQFLNRRTIDIKYFVLVNPMKSTRTIVQSMMMHCKISQ